jgi:molybdopterin molybdotransferase
MIKYSQALQQLLQYQQIVETEKIPITTANNRILAEDVYSPIHLPPYDNSAMDGYAIYSEKTSYASIEQPFWLQTSTCIGAGEKMLEQTQVNHAVAIMTGAPVPRGPDSIIPVENVLVSDQYPSSIGIMGPIASGENIRRQGEDIQTNDKLMNKGKQLTPADIMVLSGVGLEEINVFKSPEILVLVTGKELSVGMPKDKDCQIPDCNSPFLSASLSNDWSAKVQVKHILSDTENEFVDRINKACNDKNSPQVIVSTGAVSAGRYDFIPSALKKMGAEIIFHSVAIRPGKPILFAILSNGTYFFGLPGNPAAVAAGLRFFIYPFLHQSYQMQPEIPLYAKLDKEIAINKPLTFFQRAYYYTDDAGNARVSISNGQASFMISTMLKTNAWVILENGPLTLKENARVLVYRYNLHR